MSIKQKLSESILKSYGSYLSHRQSLLQESTEKRTFRAISQTGCKLTREEKEEISNRWGKLIKHIPRGYRFYEGIKSLMGFNPDYLSSSYYFPYIESVLNPAKWKSQLSHKSMTELLYGKEFNYPHTILRTYGGAYLDSAYRPLTDSEAARIVLESESPLIFKPAIETNQGAGIELISKEGLADFAESVRSRNVFGKLSDFVLQIPLSQSEETSIYNPSSLNCMRVTTLNLNGEVTVCSRALKCGPKDSVVDNIGNGRRGVIVGISPDGSLDSHGFYGNGDKADSHNGVIFKGRRIDHFPELADTAIRLHKENTACKIIGWDLALDKNNIPVLIEGNVVYPGILFEQMCSGPIFGKRTDEIIDYVAHYLKNSNRGG